MKAGLTITEMAAEIERQAAAKVDYLVNPQKLEMESMGGSPMLRVLDSGGIDQLEPLDIQETAYLQMSQYLDIPPGLHRQFSQQCPARADFQPEVCSLACPVDGSFRERGGR